MSDDEQARLGTIQALVEHKTLAIEGTDFRGTRDKIVALADSGERFPSHYYSNQPPMLAVLLSGPYWAMHRMGLTFSRDPNSIIFLLTILGVTLPVALSAGVVYRMSRTFELPRPLCALLAFVVVAGSGLISYSTVLNSHAPAAALLLVAIACLIHVIAHKERFRASIWLATAGLAAALAATIDPPAVIFLALLILVVASIRWPMALRAAGVGAYLLGAALPIAVHINLCRPITGDNRPGLFHPELAIRSYPEIPDSVPNDTAAIVASEISSASTPAIAPALAVSRSPLSWLQEDDEEPLTFWHFVGRGSVRVLAAFFGGHGVLSHFPVLVLGIVGVSLIMHRHWPAATKMMAAATLGGALIVMLIYSLSRSDARDAMFATRWFVVFLPLVLFWSGAWLRRSHRPGTWVLAGILLAFSVGVSLLGATGPLPRDGFDRYTYTVAGAWHNLIHPTQSPPLPPSVAERGNTSTFTE